MDEFEAQSRIEARNAQFLSDVLESCEQGGFLFGDYSLDFKREERLCAGGITIAECVESVADRGKT